MAAATMGTVNVPIGQSPLYVRNMVPYEKNVNTPGLKTPGSQASMAGCRGVCGECEEFARHEAERSWFRSGVSDKKRALCLKKGPEKMAFTVVGTDQNHFRILPDRSCRVRIDCHLAFTLDRNHAAARFLPDTGVDEVGPNKRPRSLYAKQRETLHQHDGILLHKETENCIDAQNRIRHHKVRPGPMESRYVSVLICPAYDLEVGP